MSPSGRTLHAKAPGAADAHHVFNENEIDIAIPDSGRWQKGHK
jgi:hypothetical protein